MELTEEMIEAAKAEIARREKARSDEYARQCAERQRTAGERFWAGMAAKWPGLSQDDMYDIYSDCRDYYE